MGNFSQMGTVNVPMMELMTPMARMIRGKTINLRLPVMATRVRPRIRAETIVTS